MMNKVTFTSHNFKVRARLESYMDETRWVIMRRLLMFGGKLPSDYIPCFVVLYDLLHYMV